MATVRPSRVSWPMCTSAMPPRPMSSPTSYRPARMRDPSSTTRRPSLPSMPGPRRALRTRSRGSSHRGCRHEGTGTAVADSRVWPSGGPSAWSAAPRGRRRAGRRAAAGGRAGATSSRPVRPSRVPAVVRCSCGPPARRRRLLGAPGAARRVGRRRCNGGRRRRRDGGGERVRRRAPAWRDQHGHARRRRARHEPVEHLRELLARRGPRAGLLGQQPHDEGGERWSTVAGSGGTGLFTCATAMSTAVGPVKGRCPTSAS